MLHIAAKREQRMTDLIFIAITVGFFALCLAYAHGCEKLRGGTND
jgi:hypothetical protein